MTRKSLWVLGAFFVSSAAAAQPMPSGQKCANLSEVALLARALAEEKVEKPRALSILRRIYSIPDDTARAFATLVIDSAYSDTAPAGQFAQRFEVVCIASSAEPPAARSPGGRAGRVRM